MANSETGINPEAKYKELSAKYRLLLTQQERLINTISNLRLLVFVLGAGSVIYLAVQKNYSVLAVAVVVFAALFIYLIGRHNRYFNQKEYTAALLKINEESLQRVRGEWQAFKDDGKEFGDDSHPYAQDLDIFGQGSLFQYINTAVTSLGRARLSELLTSHPQGIDVIAARQDAVADLAPKLDWRQKFMAEGTLATQMHDPQALFAWAGQVERIYRKRAVIGILSVLPVITIALGIVAVVVPEVNYYAFAAALLIQFALLKIYSAQRSKSLEIASKYSENIGAYSKMLDLLEQESFKSAYLQALQNGLKDAAGSTACEQIRRLAKLVDGIANRRNQFYFIFNILFLLDFQFVFALEKWKEQSGARLPDWLKAIAELEALSSLAVLKYDHPHWAMPVLTTGAPQFRAEAMGHPLLAAGVANTLKFEESAKILLITGSNMSGKSTLLRTAGLNLALAYSGTVVCAGQFTCSLLNIYTCMRVSDNLEKNISSFYAELLRIKMIVEAVTGGQQIFFLLDEIFKGTNSIDRHTGAKALIKRLSREKLLGMISTHDLELGELAGESKYVRNYHFQEYYVNDEIRFDYTLRSGVSTTRNAAFLMRMAGIDMIT